MRYGLCKSVFVSEYYKNINLRKSKDATLFIGRFRGGGDSYRSLMQFDLGKLSSDNFDKAYLIMDITRNEISQASSQVGVYRMLRDWEEKAVTWESALAQAAVPELTFTVIQGWTGLLIVDLTQLVRRWLDYTYLNYGIILVGDETINSLIAVNHSAYASTERAPHIVTLSRKGNVAKPIEVGIKE